MFGVKGGLGLHFDDNLLEALIQKVHAYILIEFALLEDGSRFPNVELNSNSLCSEFLNLTTEPQKLRGCSQLSAS